MKKLILLFIFTITVKLSFSQLFGNIEEVTKYNAKDVVDSVYGIRVYDKLNFQIGGDSIRNNKKGYACQGWVQDLYESGKVLHKGYYEDGQLKIYKNFYENGMVERNFKMADLNKSSLQLFYPDGKIKSDNTYINGSMLTATDYYPNGQIAYTMENVKTMEYLIFRKSYSEDGKPQEIFELVNAKKNIYSEKEYFENGNLKSEGQLKFNPYKVDYIKDGIWKIYNAAGILIKQEKWIYGEEVKNN
jgi:antitoxin component YwqK of YwqJK toxin-antitoxin module